MKRIAMTLSALALGTTGVGAQEIGLGLSGGQVTDEAGVQHRGLTAAAHAAWRQDGSVLRLHGQATALQQGGWLGGAGLALDAAGGGWGPLRLALAGQAAAGASGQGYRGASALLSPDLRVGQNGWGMGAGPRLAMGGQRPGGSQLLGGEPAGLLPWGRRETRETAVSWATAHGVGAGVWGGRGPLSLRADWRGMRAEHAAWRDWTGAAALRAGPATLGISAGLRTGDEQTQWVAGSAAVRLREHAVLRVEAGTYPSDPLMGRAQGSYASVGVSFSSGDRPGFFRSAAPQPPRAPDGRIRLSLRAHPGARVELLGDWTGWRPQAVPELEPGRYVVDVKLPAGTHRFLFRVDGESRVPEEFPTEPDQFGGHHAVIRVGEQ